MPANGPTKRVLLCCVFGYRVLFVPVLDRGVIAAINKEFYISSMFVPAATKSSLSYLVAYSTVHAAKLAGRVVKVRQKIGFFLCRRSVVFAVGTHHQTFSTLRTRLKLQKRITGEASSQYHSDSMAPQSFRLAYNSFVGMYQSAVAFKEKKGLTHAIIMLFSLSILLSVIYTQTRPIAYVHPHATIKTAIGFETANNMESVDDSKCTCPTNEVRVLTCMFVLCYVWRSMGMGQYTNQHGRWWNTQEH